MEIENRQAALCVFRQGDEFLFVELKNSQNGTVLHRPPGGGMEPGETPETAVRRELQEELGLDLQSPTALGFIDHIWFWNGRDGRERAWIFLADASDYPALLQASTLLEADGKQHPLVWRKLLGYGLPPVCPAELPAFLQANWER